MLGSGGNTVCGGGAVVCAGEWGAVVCAGEWG